MDNTIRGKEGEELACKFLQNEGHEILARNFRNRLGEIDVITRKRDYIFFIEVKNWEHSFITPLEVFTKKKIGIMRKLAEFFLFSNPEYREIYFVSFCLIEIQKNKVQFHRDLF